MCLLLKGAPPEGGHASDESRCGNFRNPKACVLSDTRKWMPGSCVRRCVTVLDADVGLVWEALESLPWSFLPQGHPTDLDCELLRCDLRGARRLSPFLLPLRSPAQQVMLLFSFLSHFWWRLMCPCVWNIPFFVESKMLLFVKPLSYVPLGKKKSFRWTVTWWFLIS